MSRYIINRLLLINPRAAGRESVLVFAMLHLVPRRSHHGHVLRRPARPAARSKRSRSSWASTICPRSNICASSPTPCGDLGKSLWGERDCST